MKEYMELKNKIESIIERANSDKPACKNCKSYCDGACTLNCVNERNGNRYNFQNKRMTTPGYSCEKFDAVYAFNESTLDNLRDLLSDIERVNECVTNLEALLNGKINEDEFNEIVK